MKLHEIEIAPRTMDGHFPLSGVRGNWTYHIWVTPEWEIKDGIVYGNDKDHKKTTLLLTTEPKRGAEIAETLIQFAKNFRLMDSAREKERQISAKRQAAVEKRAAAKAEKESAYRALIFVAKRLRKADFGTDDGLNELKNISSAALKVLGL